MYLVICKRNDSKGNDVFFPIMRADEDGEISDVMATWDSIEDAEDYCNENVLCKKSTNIIVDTKDEENSYLYSPPIN